MFVYVGEPLNENAAWITYHSITLEQTKSSVHATTFRASRSGGRLWLWNDHDCNFSLQPRPDDAPYRSTAQTTRPNLGVTILGRRLDRSTHLDEYLRKACLSDFCKRYSKYIARREESLLSFLVSPDRSRFGRVEESAYVCEQGTVTVSYRYCRRSPFAVRPLPHLRWNQPTRRRSPRRI